MGEGTGCGFYGIEFAYQLNGAGRSKHGVFCPDFFLLLADTDEVIVVETKSDPDDSPKNAGKVAHALMLTSSSNGSETASSTSSSQASKPLSARDPPMSGCAGLFGPDGDSL